MLREVSGDDEVTGLGIASTGPIDMAAGIIAPATVAEWATGFEIVERGRELYPDAIVRMASDGVCLALAEQRYGKVGSTLDALVVSVSAQITGGVLIGGFIAVGHTGNAGNIGHVVTAGHDDPCTCGGRGCTEAVAGGSAMVRWARDRGWIGTTVDQLLRAAESGESTATAALRRSGSAVGQAISSAAALLDVDLAVIGGACATAGPAWWRPLHEAVATHARLSFLSGLRVLPSSLGTDGILIGAAALALPVTQATADAS
jgi:glucokinase